ncbi:hypothetical protein DFJ73DRAFT_757915 [Zopfochytrium polystomum]|nr:hypothetical protein DFJ73DRAFT_757915 [Zopfochytrium polystomum]
MTDHHGFPPPSLLLPSQPRSTPFLPDEVLLTVLLADPSGRLLRLGRQLCRSLGDACTRHMLAGRRPRGGDSDDDPIRDRDHDGPSVLSLTSLSAFDAALAGLESSLQPEPSRGPVPTTTTTPHNTASIFHHRSALAALRCALSRDDLRVMIFQLAPHRGVPPSGRGRGRGLARQHPSPSHHYVDLDDLDLVNDRLARLLRGFAQLRLLHIDVALSDGLLATLASTPSPQLQLRGRPVVATLTHLTLRSSSGAPDGATPLAFRALLLAARSLTCLELQIQWTLSEWNRRVTATSAETDGTAFDDSNDPAAATPLPLRRFTYWFPAFNLQPQKDAALLSWIAARAPRVECIVVTKDGPVDDLYAPRHPYTAAGLLASTAEHFRSLRSLTVVRNRHPLWVREDEWFHTFALAASRLEALCLDLRACAPDDVQDELSLAAFDRGLATLPALRVLDVRGARWFSAAFLARLLATDRPASLALRCLRLETVPLDGFFGNPADEDDGQGDDKPWLADLGVVVVTAALDRLWIVDCAASATDAALRRAAADTVAPAPRAGRFVFSSRKWGRVFVSGWRASLPLPRPAPADAPPASTAGTCPQEEASSAFAHADADADAAAAADALARNGWDFEALARNPPCDYRFAGAHGFPLAHERV